MERIFGTLIGQFQQFYKSLTPTKRLSVVGVAFVIFISISLVVLMVSGKDYAVLFKDVAADDLPLVISTLKSKNIPFGIQGDGNTIAVPKELLYSTQMMIMTEVGTSDLGVKGLELFDKQDFGTTSYAQRINYQRALQGELSRAINSLSVVRKSKVMLAIPPKKTFMEEGNSPTASVIVEIIPGKVLAEDQVRGISYLVANSVEGMEAENVSVIDSRGRTLSKNYKGGTSATSELHDLKVKVEEHFQTKILALMDRVVGDGKASVEVSVRLNSAATSSLEEMVDPEKIATRSTQTEEESLDGSRTNPAGIPGARANLPGAEDQGRVGFNQNVKKEFKTTNYEVSKSVKNRQEAAGGLESISVAVLVDGVSQKKIDGEGNESIEYIPRTEEDLQKIENIVKSAIGFNPTRGDNISIENFRFVQPDFGESDKLLTTLERKKLVHALFKWALLGFSLALFFFMVIRPFMRWITDSFQDNVEDMLPRTIEELEELQTTDNTLPGMSNALPTLQQAMDPDKAESELLKERIMSIMADDEELASSAFSLWLAKRE